MSDYRLIYSTWPDAASAEAAGAAAVEAGLAACANILPGATSLFRWDGAMQRQTEVVMLLKTGAARAEALIAALAARHPYDTPALVSLPLDADAGARPFLDWIDTQTRPPQDSGTPRP